MNNDLVQLLDLFDKPIPAAQERKRTLFDIAGFPHYETVISKWYAYFLQSNEDHGLKNIFIDSLLQLVERKTGKRLQLNQFDVRTEVVTIENGKRIDILVTGTGDNEGKFVIIENKIYHWLHNDLGEYWNHCKTDDVNKIGIVLTLSKESIPDTVCDYFVNICHSEWMDEIRSSQDRINGMNNKSEVYFDDFCTTITNLTKNLTMDEQTRFFFKNLEQVKKVRDTEDAAYRFVLGQLRFAAEELNLNFTGSSYDYRYFEIPDFTGSGVYYTVLFNELFQSNRTIWIVIEFHHQILPKLAFIEEKLDLKLEPGLLYKPKRHGDSWLHFIGKSYSFDMSELENLGQRLAESIRVDFQPKMNKIVSILKNS